ncbi:MAG: hypothetical protein ABS939_08280 [Psychrobacillus sp.]
MYYDPRVEQKANHICHMVSKNEEIVLSDKSRSDIFLTTRAVADYWKKDSDKIREENYAKRWNEFKLLMKRFPLAMSLDDITIAIHTLDNGGSVRSYVPLCLRESEGENNE